VGCAVFTFFGIVEIYNYWGQVMGFMSDLKETTENATPSRQPKKAVCPSCNQEATFTCIGHQHWPDNVARALDMNPVIALWRCSNCRSTVTLEQNNYQSPDQ
jgi:transcription elongation factor Elf1